LPSQGYELEIAADGVTITAPDAAGVFYGVCTLIQMVDSVAAVADGPAALPFVRISDWPDFPVRGLLLDVSSDKVPTMETLLDLVDMLAGWKINQLELYAEHTFAYRNHPVVWADASPLTGQEILDLDAFCQERHIELVPNQNSFGHMNRWLRHERYAPLAEYSGWVETPWGPRMAPHSLCPVDPGSLELLRGLYDELLPHFHSRLLNVGCDEADDVGLGRSKDVCEARGKGQVYVDFLLQIYSEVTARDHTMTFYADVIKHYPELIAQLPKDCIGLDWGYDAEYLFDAATLFADGGVPFYVLPGTSAWDSLSALADRALANTLNAAEQGLAKGAIGYVNTDWGTRGHLQVLPVSYLGLAAGAAYSWCLEANRDADMEQVVSWHAFRDATGTMGRVAQKLGTMHRVFDSEPTDSSPLFCFLHWPLAALQEFAGRTASIAECAEAAAQRDILPLELPMRKAFSYLKADALQQAEAAIQDEVEALGQAHMRRPDAALILREVEHTAHLMRHACRRGMLAIESEPGKASALRKELSEDMREIIRDHMQIWLTRNRPGGLRDSVARLEKMRADYLSEA
jgi:hypothetical protein